MIAVAEVAMSSSEPTPTTDAKKPQAEESPVSPSDDSLIRPDGVGKEGSKEGDVSSTEETAQGYIALIVTLHPFTPTTPRHPLALSS